MVLQMRDTADYHLVYIFTSLPVFKIDFGMGITTDLKILYKKVKEPAKESPVLCPFFNETISSVEVFEKTKTEDSLISKLFSKN